METKIVATIMAGGKGERFWPKSRRARPKQFLNLMGTGTMLQETVRRILPLVPWDRVNVITGEDYGPLVRAQLPLLGGRNLILEPEGRDTAAAIGYAAIQVADEHPGSVMLVLPSDHWIKDEEGFRQELAAAAAVAAEGALVTLGIVPSSPETGYGYLEIGEKLGERGTQPFFRVNRFTEKPDRETAKALVESRCYWWNSGIFLWRPEVILGEISVHLPALGEALDRIRAARGTSAERLVAQEEFANLKSGSIDYGVMEKADRVVVFPGVFGWDDVGTWAALSRLSPRDVHGNLIKGRGLAVDSRNCLIDNGSEMLVAVYGVENLIIVQSEDCFLVLPRERAQEIKKLLGELKARDMEEFA